MPDTNPSPLDFTNQAMADVLTAAYTEERLTQKILVERTGMTLTTMQRILAGKRDIDINQLFRLADALGVSAEEIVDRALKRAAKLAQESARRQAGEEAGNVTPIR